MTRGRGAGRVYMIGESGLNCTTIAIDDDGSIFKPCFACGHDMPLHELKLLATPRSERVDGEPISLDLRDIPGACIDGCEKSEREYREGVERDGARSWSYDGGSMIHTHETSWPDGRREVRRFHRGWYNPQIAIANQRRKDAMAEYWREVPRAAGAPPARFLDDGRGRGLLMLCAVGDHYVHQGRIGRYRRYGYDAEAAGPVRTMCGRCAYETGHVELEESA